MYALGLVFTIFLAVSNNIFLHFLTDDKIKNIGEKIVFNGFVSLIWIPIVFLIGGCHLEFDVMTVAFGILYGVMLAAFLLFKMLAMSTGPISLTTLIGCCSLIIPTLLGTVIWKEDFTVLQFIGLIGLLISLFLGVSPKKETRKFSGKWLLFSFLFFISAGMSSLVFKIHQTSPVKAKIDSMMFVAATVSFILLIVFGFSYNKVKKLPKPSVNKKLIKFILACGLVSCLYNRVNIVLSGVLPSIVFFPIFNGAVILCSSISGILIFKEKIKLPQIISLIGGTASIILLSGIL